jgi:SSS family solute:Na+ symporter
VIIFFKYIIADASVIAKLFTFAGYTYGPLLGLYAYGMLTKWKVKDLWVPLVAIATPFLGYAISFLCETAFNFEFGFFILILNGALTFLGLILIRTKKD